MKENEKIWAVKDSCLVNRDGSIYKLNYKRTGTMRKVKQWIVNGYLRFYYNGKDVLVHRFVSECFLPNPDNLPCINHKDEIKTNNCVDNLEWCDYKYNNNYGTHNKRMSEAKKNPSEETRRKMSEAQKNDPRKSKKVLQYTKDGKFVKEWVSMMEVQRVLGYKSSNISNCCNGRCESAYGYIWRCEIS